MNDKLKMISDNIVKVSIDQLPLSCPTMDTAALNHHPRVFLHLSSTQTTVTCPYCGKHYELAKS